MRSTGFDSPKLALVALASTLLAGTAAAQDLEPSEIDVAELGPQVGDVVPDFRLPDQYGEYWTRESIMGPRGAMLVFVRSADW
ncbi:MAG: hypothetical protein PVH89_09395 [Gammaproteobacteria bacterium]|jgi:hypothetical protein